MPEFNYRGRDKTGNLKVGQRFSANMDILNAELIKEGVFPIQITPIHTASSSSLNVKYWFQRRSAYLQELSIFSRQMQLLQQANVPTLDALKQLWAFSKALRLKEGIKGVIEQIEKGMDLSTAMSMFPNAFPAIMINMIKMGQSTGHLDQAFLHSHQYIEFEIQNSRQTKSVLRYPMFLLVTTLAAVIVLNVFVIPTFAQFYGNMKVNLPWETTLLIGMSDFLVSYGWYLLFFFIGLGSYIFYLLKKPKGRYAWHVFQLRLPLIGRLLKRIALIHFSQALSIALKSGVSIVDGLKLAAESTQNTKIRQQILKMLEAIQGGTTFTQASKNNDLFGPMELQIFSVGEKNGELGAALEYIAQFYSRDIEYDLKRLNDIIAPLLIAILSGLILILALGVYLPIWNMVNLVNH